MPYGGAPESGAVDPVPASKRCRIGLVDGAPALRPAVRGTFFRSSARATCGEGHVHRVPEPTCTCGFYALGDSQELHDRLGPWRPEEVELDIELTGRVVRHERGLRGEHQSVLGVRVHPMCALCAPRSPRKTVVVGRIERGRRRADWDGLVPLCDRCASQAAELWTVPGLAAALGAEVTVDRDTQRAQPSRRLTSRSRVRLGVGTVLATIYLALGLTVAVRGVDVGSRIGPDELAIARRAADDITASVTGNERTGAVVDGLVRTALASHYRSIDAAEIDVSIDGGVDVAARIDQICILATDTGAWEARAVREASGPCTTAEARALRPIASGSS